MSLNSSSRPIELVASEYRINRLAVMDGKNLFQEVPCNLKLDIAYIGGQPDELTYLSMPDFLSINIKDLPDLSSAISSIIANSHS